MPRGGLIVLAFHLCAACELESVEQLRDRYGEVFKTGNRNAASHLWTSYILQHAQGCSTKTIETLFRGFCPVSGSPLPDDPHTQYSVTLKSVHGEDVNGISHHCCWPCICDMQENVQVDTMTINTLEGEKKMNVFVIGDPCASSSGLAKLSSAYIDPFSGARETLQDSAPEVVCRNGRLGGATFSDNGYPVLGIFPADSVVPGTSPQKAELFQEKCEARKKEGYDSGMGLIFHKVAVINPISLAQEYKQFEVDAQRTTSGTYRVWRFATLACLAAIVMVMLRFSSRRDDLACCLMEMGEPQNTLNNE